MSKAIGKCSIEVVHGCPLRCVGCPMSVLKTPIKFINKDVFKMVISHIDVKIQLLRLFTFGEPMLHQQLPELIEMVPKKRIKRLEVSTSGQFCNEKPLMEIFSTGKLNSLCVSCDGDGSLKTYEKMRPPAKWEKLIQFMTTAKELRDKYSPKTKLTARIINTGKAKTWKKLCAKLGWVPELRHFKQLPGAVAFTGARKKPKGLCKFVYSQRLYVDYDGTVTPCCRHPRAFVMGNILDMPYTKLKHSKQYKKAKAYLKHNRHKIKICSQCDKT